MCLVDKKQFRCSDRKIPIWKVVLVDKGRYYAPYKGNRLYHLNQITEIGDEHQLCNFPDIIYRIRRQKNWYIFESGFFHACTNKSAAESLVDSLNKAGSSWYPSLKHIVVEGYIPEDVRYALDLDGNGICARKMILNI